MLVSITDHSLLTVIECRRLLFLLVITFCLSFSSSVEALGFYPVSFPVFLRIIVNFFLFALLHSRNVEIILRFAKLPRAR